MPVPVVRHKRDGTSQLNSLITQYIRCTSSCARCTTSLPRLAPLVDTPTTAPISSFPHPHPYTQVAFLAPNSTACFDAFEVIGKDDATGKALPSQTISNSLSTTFQGLTPGQTYTFQVATTSKSKDLSTPVSARVAMPPGVLNTQPGPPERFSAVASSDSSVQLTWQLPAGNPKVLSYIITVKQTNGTGAPLAGKTAGPGDASVKVDSDKRTHTVTGLQPGSYFMFAIQASIGGCMGRQYGRSRGQPSFMNV